MKTIVKQALMGAFLLAGAGGCETYHYHERERLVAEPAPPPRQSYYYQPAPSPVYPPPQQEIIVTEAPPPERYEVVPAPPSPRHVWVRGYWQHDDRRWDWRPGYYVIRPQPYSQWVPTQWVPTRGGWRCVQGHWQ